MNDYAYCHGLGCPQKENCGRTQKPDAPEYWVAPFDLERHGEPCKWRTPKRPTEAVAGDDK